MRFRFSVYWQLQSDNGLIDIPQKLLTLLNAIAEGENLRQAAQSLGVSYRSAWGLIGDWETSFSTPLVISERGRGTKLTTFALALLESKAEVESMFRDSLAAAAESASGQLTRMSTADSTALRIVSSDHVAVTQLAKRLRQVPERRVVLDIIGSESALRRYQRPDADVAGFHIPTGRNFAAIAERLIKLLNAQRDEIYQIEQRQLGLVYQAHLNI